MFCSNSGLAGTALYPLRYQVSTRLPKPLTHSGSCFTTPSEYTFPVHLMLVLYSMHSWAAAYKPACSNRSSTSSSRVCSRSSKSFPHVAMSSTHIMQSSPFNSPRKAAWKHAVAFITRCGMRVGAISPSGMAIVIVKISRTSFTNGHCR